MGARDSADALTDAGTELIDLNGRMCLWFRASGRPNHLASMAITKVGINLSGVVGRAEILSKIRDWISAQPSDAPCTDTAGCRIYSRRSPRREWLDEVTGGRPMYLLSADAHDRWFNTAAMQTAGVGPNTPDPDPGSQYCTGFRWNPMDTPLRARIS